MVVVGGGDDERYRSVLSIHLDGLASWHSWQCIVLTATPSVKKSSSTS